MALTNTRQGEHAIPWRLRSQSLMHWKRPDHGFDTQWDSSPVSIIFCGARFPPASYGEARPDIWVFRRHVRFVCVRLWHEADIRVRRYEVSF